MKGGFLLQAIIYLMTAIVCVPIAKRLGMGSVLGYLLSGILIGPFVLGFIGEEGQDIMHFAEFGVVVMLFLVGLELEPGKFWQMRKMIVGSGLIQVAGTTALFFLIGLLLDFSWQASFSIGFALAMSSTAIVLQSLKEKGLMTMPEGQSSFAILLFQDISVIPVLAILPLLATHAISASDSHHTNFLDGLPALVQTLIVFAAIGFVILAGRFIIVPLLHIVAKTQLRELFTASALLIVVGIAFLMELVGLSPALGTFLAGMVLANSEYRHELESDLDPFKGLLLGLFFIAVGASINFHLISDNPGLIAALVTGVVAGKAVVLTITGKLLKLSTRPTLFLALGLSQVGEFAFVLFSFIGQLTILDAHWVGIMMAVTAISMTITPLLLLTNEKLIAPKMNAPVREEKDADVIDEHHKVIIAGYSHFGSTIGRFLRANGVKATILDNNSDQVDLVRKMGFKAYYGDATRVDLLKSAGAENAKILVIAMGYSKATHELIETVQKHFPHLQIMVRSKNRYDAYELIDLGVKNIYRETVHTSIALGVDVLKSLGYRSYSATRSGQNFLKYDEEALWKLAPTRHNIKDYISNIRYQVALQEQLLSTDRQEDPTLNDHAWDSEFMREAINKKK